MKKKLISILTVALSCMLVLGGCGGKGKTTEKTPAEVKSGPVEGYVKATDSSKNVSLATDRKDTLVIGINAPEGIFNPLYSESAYDIYIMESMFTGMIAPDEKGLPVEALAESYKISEDGKTYSFKLRDGLKFDDGTPLTTEDVAFTFTAGCDKEYDGVADFVNTTKIKGAKAYKEGTASTIEGIKVVDDKNIEFTLEEVNADAIYDFTAQILSKAYYGKGYTQGHLNYIKDLHAKPLGCGAYKFVENKPGQEVDLVANENYYLGKVKIPNLIYKVTSETTRIQMLQTGEIDMDMVTVNQDNVGKLQEAGFLDLHVFPTNGYGYIGFNMKDEKFTDVKVRQALTYGLNRKEIVEAVYAGGYADVINVPQSKESWAYSKPKNDYEFDKEKAGKLLDEAGWKVGSDGIREKDGKKLEIKFTASTPNDVNDAIIPVAQANYQEIGIKFEAEQMDFNAVREQVTSGKAQMFFMAWGLTPKIDNTGILGTGGAQNKTGYSNPELDALFLKGLQETDTEKRKAIYADVYELINKELPYIFMYQRRDMWAVNSRVKGFENQITPYKNFTYSLNKLTLE
ncbi:ABC transporter substrate-binding protein [Clostridium gasigenes]|uniref:ABC transporter substrate-binding protein n=1 Tax=Clostridium gasigenes TaxID=94869 RepID=UPI0014383146|nr:ABC transporter substrate-binding protein [Clostridium gasigenes]NKF08202.1 ABC transporter substrate-binding protein [Clostridium gasigenes]QSW18449.1 ABC transporter substrate-binding protein [Clostridium gasigenes]